MADVTDPTLALPAQHPDASPPGVIEVFWWTRGGRWLARVSGRGWTGFKDHVGDGATDLALLHAAQVTFGHQATQGARLVRRPDSARVPKGEPGRTP